MNTYQETLDYLYSRLPVYSRIGAAAYKKDLDNTIALCNILNNPQNNFKSIHIAGTNGKGSTSHILAAILQQAGYKTGLYTSPHLKDFRERIRVNGKMIEKNFIIDFAEKYKRDFEAIQPSFFEMTVGLCFEYFKVQQVDIAVIETGLGGRLDSTNIITPRLSVITNISFDHKDLLGNTLEKIAAEKAGIIKRNVPVVIGETQSESKNIFIQKAEEENAPIHFADKMWTVTTSIREKEILKLKIENTIQKIQTEYELDLTGDYQKKNIITILASVAQLRLSGFSISESSLHNALAHVKQITGLRGRWDILSNDPLTITDVGHNEAGIKEVLQQLSHYAGRKIHFVLGFVKEKDVSSILRLFPKEQTYYFCKPGIDRGMDAVTLQQKAQEAGLKGKIYPSVTSAVFAAKASAGKNDVIYIGGSTFVVSEIF